LLAIAGKLLPASEIHGKPKDVANMAASNKVEDLAQEEISTLAAPGQALALAPLLESELERLPDIGIVANHPAHGQAKLQSTSQSTLVPRMVIPFSVTKTPRAAATVDLLSFATITNPLLSIMSLTDSLLPALLAKASIKLVAPATNLPSLLDQSMDKR
jgi:hypothetical protein